MHRAPPAGLDLGLYARAVALLARNPSIVVVPLLMAVVGVLVGRTMASSGGGPFSVGAGGLAGLIVLLLQMFGLGAACIIADDAWRHGRASFDRGWEEARRRGGDILGAAMGFTLLLVVAQYVGTIFGALALILTALVFYFLIWTLPAAAVGGVPGGAAIQESIDRVRAAPVVAAVVAVVSLAAFVLVGSSLPVVVIGVLAPYVPATPLAFALVVALFQAIALGYVALVLTKTYVDGAFGRR